jgi:uncharacterized protein (UPF0548 family)/ligand-binding SRPBCC domain-containing protein
VTAGAATVTRCEDRKVPSRFTILTSTDASCEELFDASLSIDAHVQSMGRSGERAVAGVTSGSIGLDETVTWRARHFGIWFRLTSRITALDRPHRFVDEQVRGPFRSFHHEHAFRHADGATVMTDTLTIASPVFGRLAERAVLVPYLRRLIRQRNAHLIALIGASHRPVSMTRPSTELWPVTPRGLRRYERHTRIGSGEVAWARASADLLRWTVKTRSGFEVSPAQVMEAGARPTIAVRFAGVTVHEPVEIVEVVRQADCVGFAYRTLPGHPVRGEEAFILRRSGDAVTLTIRSLTRPSDRLGWALAYPLLRVAQAAARRRYRAALTH